MIGNQAGNGFIIKRILTLKKNKKIPSIPAVLFEIIIGNKNLIYFLLF